MVLSHVINENFSFYVSVIMFNKQPFNKHAILKIVTLLTSAKHQ